MSSSHALIRHLASDLRGAALMEFALIAPAFLTLLMGGLDTGYTVYLNTIAAGTIESTARASSLAGATESQFNRDIRSAVAKILPVDVDPVTAITITQKNYKSFSRIGEPEKLTTDKNGNGLLDSGDCWLDEDGDGEFGTNNGAAGIGGPDDAVYHIVQVTVPRLFPVHELLGLPENTVVTVKTLVINQPYGAQPVRPTVCKP